ncbi:hypothetical protein Pcinc_023792 [Petrolisthes cinctipes]|uniref:Alpha N-terminal protein methyltransferase 1 n=1 Tax=Petrolisthes cinctipes TaxID=88211 RepID=A0AAE1FB83_PETCI|nr:hypothetical protein Pcinc_023792 [Petrolisthes cinctipes]
MSEVMDNGEVHDVEEPEMQSDIEEEDEEELLQKALKAQEDPAFYEDAAAYWEKIPATVNGMLGGFSQVHTPDISSSELYIQSIFKMKNPPGHGRAADCGAGIGRITKSLLQKHFGKVDLIEQCPNFIQQAKEAFKGSKKIGEFVCQGLQHFSPPPNTYDVVWSQWVLGHLNDRDLEQFFRRMASCLKPNGVIVVKENVTSSGIVELDEVDSSVTRPLQLLLSIIEQADLKVLKNSRQPNLPKGLYEVRMLCLRHKDQ